MDNISASKTNNSAEARLPSQAESNPRGQCGAITTRSGITIEPILPTPVTSKAYIPPAKRREKGDGIEDVIPLPTEKEKS